MCLKVRDLLECFAGTELLVDTFFLSLSFYQANQSWWKLFLTLSIYCASAAHPSPGVPLRSHPTKTVNPAGAPRKWPSILPHPGGDLGQYQCCLKKPSSQSREGSSHSKVPAKVTARPHGQPCQCRPCRTSLCRRCSWTSPRK